MATSTATITQSNPAIVNQPVTFVLTMSPAAGVSVVGVQVIVLDMNGQVAQNVYVSNLAATPLLQTYPFQVTFYSPVLLGSPTQPNTQYEVSAAISMSDNTTAVIVPLNVPVSAPILGQATWSQPTNAPNITSLQFSTPGNSAFIL